MLKKMLILFSVFIIALFGLIFKLYSISADENINQTAVNQSTYKLSVEKFRGTIYDCNNNALVNNGSISTKATILPSVNSANILHNILSIEDMNNIYNLLSSGKPFLIDFPKSVNMINNQDIQCFNIQERYKNKSFCSHIIGYIDGYQKGVTGLELSYNDYLNDIDSEIAVSYKVDALGKAISEQNPKVKNTEYEKSKGVLTTIDKNIQEIIENVSKRHIKKGSVIVTEVPNCEIRAIMSLPTYSPLNLDAVLEDENSTALFNRSLASYNLGSVFKLVTACAGLEDGINSEEIYNCTGSVNVDGVTFHCFDGTSHGEVDMEKAIAYSCNCYFIDLAQKMGYTDIYELAEDLGFNKELELAPQLESSKGCLPDIAKLKQEAVMANFSFGQGELLATPIQVNGMINAIVSNGIYQKPKLINGLVNSNLELVEGNKDNNISSEVISPWYAEKIKKYMISAVEYGTAREGKPSKFGAGAKTGTAQTGQFKNGKEIIQCWYAGFYPAENPKYVITVFVEDGTGPSYDCAPVFKEITDNLQEYLTID